MTDTKKLFLMLIGVGIFLALVGYFAGPYGKNNIPLIKKDIVKINNQEISVDIADTEEERKQGLSGRESLSEGIGMLFVFSSPTKPVFWMKDMKFAIDIIWIKDNKIFGVDKNVLPEQGVSEQNLKLYPAPDNINYVLEVPSGYTDKFNIKAGDSVSLPASLTR